MTLPVGFRRGLLLAATGIMFASTAARAQEMDGPDTPARANLPPGAIVQPLDTGPGAELRRNLVTLANNPRSIDALIGAGRAANAMGDAEAALGFFSRADEIDPANARVKAGMASALVQMERPDQALSLFSRAAALGAPETEIAADRGLAYDLMGDPHRAQQEYNLALRRGADAEVERRLALSLAISGHREEALRVLDAQLRRRDRAGWRTQAFVLALTGDSRGAEDTAGRMMTGANATAMMPFFQRLHMLTPAQKAAAVHFGRFPSNVTRLQIANNEASVPEVPTAAPPRARPQPAEPLNGRDRRRPSSGEAPVNTLIRTARRGDEAPPVEPRTQQPVQVTQAAPRSQPPLQVAQAAPRRFEPPQPEPDPEAKPPEVQPGIQTQPSEPPAPTGPQPTDIPPSAPATAGFSFAQNEAPAFRPSEPASQPPIVQPTDFRSVAELVQSLPPEVIPPAPPRPAPSETRSPTPARTAAAPARQTRTAEAQPTTRGRAARNAPPPNPARHWVQIAGGANRSSLPREFTRLRDQAPALLRNRTPYAVAAGATNRLLVGPFDGEREAQAFVNQLGDRDIRAFSWTSAAGQEIERLQVAGAPTRTAATPSRTPERTTRTADRTTRSAGAGARQGHRSADNETRSTRNRSSQEQGTSSRGRRSR